MARPCPVCGAPNGACRGSHEQQLAKPIVQLRERDPDAPIVRVRPHVRPGRGVAGWSGRNVVVVDIPADAGQAQAAVPEVRPAPTITTRRA